MAPPVLTVFARWPEPGLAKTRLIPALGAEGAARVYARLLAHTLAEARASGLAVELRTTGAPAADFRERFGEDLQVVAQGEGDLGARMARVPPPAILIGSDCPDCDAAILRRAGEVVTQGRAAIGPARDGGYYLLGLPTAAPFLFEDMAWSTSGVFAETMRRFADAGIAPEILPELDDIDTAEDLARHPGFTP